ncbi:uncharacterized protein LOC114005264 [Tupaia chinensis]|uniref:uncharacterized protein LOC114005264 n=1 Tax=Tupaia chinensis TaxID=246437 RepID=UPI000FFB3478|nr:uncharacterized protein LOC114005264 [Tupaia chinensis]
MAFSHPEWDQSLRFQGGRSDGAVLLSFNRGSWAGHGLGRLPGSVLGPQLDFCSGEEAAPAAGVTEAAGSLVSAGKATLSLGAQRLPHGGCFPVGSNERSEDLHIRICSLCPVHVSLQASLAQALAFSIRAPDQLLAQCSLVLGHMAFRIIGRACYVQGWQPCGRICSLAPPCSHRCEPTGMWAELGVGIGSPATAAIQCPVSVPEAGSVVGCGGLPAHNLVEPYPSCVSPTTPSSRAQQPSRGSARVCVILCRWGGLAPEPRGRFRFSGGARQPF